MGIRRRAQPGAVIGWRRGETALHHHAVAVAEFGVTRRAIDPVAFLTAPQQRHRHRRRGHRLRLIIDDAGRQRAWRRPGDPRSRSASTDGSCRRNRSTAPAATPRSRGASFREGPRPAPVPVRSSSVCARASTSSSLLSIRSTQRSWLARRMPVASSTGSYSFGIRLIAMNATNPAATATSAAFSNVVGMNDGHENAGRPPISNRKAKVDEKLCSPKLQGRRREPGHQI